MKLLKIKFENIICGGFALWFINCIISHKIEDAGALMLEIMIYSICIAIVYTIVYDFRKKLSK